MMRMMTAVIALFLVSSSAAQPVAVTPAGRDTYFISDLHLGLGRTQDGGWHPMEDFRWHKEFDLFVEHLKQSTGRSADLVILGDFLELWQSDKEDCPEQVDANIGCSVSDAAARTQRVVSAHPQLFESLADFLRHEDNALIIVPGNHDAALLTSESQAIVLAAFPVDVRDRVTVESDALWVSEDGLVAAEHGQQIGDDPNKYSNWPSPPVREYHGSTHMVQPWGEKFVQGVFNGVEDDYSIIDNFSGRLEALSYYKASANWGDELKDMGRLLRFLSTQQSAAHLRQVLSADGTMHAEWNISGTRQRLRTDQDRWSFLLSTLSDAELREALAKEPAPEVPDFQDEEIEAICDIALAISNCPDGDSCRCVSMEPPKLAAIGEGIANSLNSERENKVLASYLENLSASRLDGKRVKFYVYGHTHDARTGFTPASSGVTVYNDGAWQRTITVAGLESLREKMQWSKAELLREARPEHLPACYPYVHLVPSSVQGRRSPKLLYWNYRESDGKTCPSVGCNHGFLKGGSC